MAVLDSRFLGTDGDEPVGSLDHPTTGRSRRFWGWLELIAPVEECVGQLGPANTEEQEQEHPATLTEFLTRSE
jgi:hypothetical protein